MMLRIEPFLADIDNGLAILEYRRAVAMRRGRDAGDFLERVVESRPDDMGVDVDIYGVSSRLALVSAQPTDPMLS
jgi:hypothetical protein